MMFNAVKPASRNASARAQIKFFLRSFHDNRRCSSHAQNPSLDTNHLRQRYSLLKGLISERHQQLCGVDGRSIYSVNQINLGKLDIYGFDYDYTLAQYSDALLSFIYQQASLNLVHKYGFPEDILNMEFVPDFCIRGLHFDIKRSLLMKIDANNIIQGDTVHRGLEKLDSEQVLQEFDGRMNIPKKIMDQSYVGGESIKQLMDEYAIPEMMLLANVVQYFQDNNISYDHLLLFRKVKNSVRDVHISGMIYKEITSNLDTYLQKDKLCDLFDYLSEANKTLFLITNSGFDFVNKGMRYIVGADWMDAFDVVIVDANKPTFFKRNSHPLKVLNNSYQTYSDTFSWQRVRSLQKGVVYQGGSIYELMELTGWDGANVLYFGDQIYNDLSDPTFSHGWRTGAIIPELEKETSLMNTKVFGQSLIWTQTLERLLERLQVYRDAESKQLLKEWLGERQQLKQTVKNIFNPQFGSVFRSHLSPSYFTGRLCRIADIYTSSVENLTQYYPDHFFFPLRSPLPHEHIVSMAYQHDGYDSAIEEILNRKF